MSTKTSNSLQASATNTTCCSKGVVPYLPELFEQLECHRRVFNKNVANLNGYEHCLRVVKKEMDAGY